MAFSQIVKHRVGVQEVTIRHAKDRNFDDMTMMPDFFAKDFSVATTTGFIRVWDGTYVMLKYIEDHEEIFNLSKGANCIELGSGAGLLGIALATLGGNVLLSDVESSVDCITRHNIELNAVVAKTSPSNFFVEGITATCIGKGSAAALPIDWMVPEIDTRVMDSLADCDHIFVCDCIWLPEFATLCAGVCVKLLAKCRAGTRVQLSYPHRGEDPKCARPRDIENIFGSQGLCVRWILTKDADPANKFESFDISLLEAFLPTSGSDVVSEPESIC